MEIIQKNLTDKKPLEQKVSDLEKSVKALFSNAYHDNQEITCLKKSIKQSIKLFNEGKPDEAMDVLTHECREFWMSEETQKRWDSLT